MTPFDEIYKMFLSSLKSYDLFNMTDREIEEDLVMWLEKAVASFSYYSHKEIMDTDFESEYFNVELNLVERMILSKFMLLHYVSMHVVDMESMEQTINSKEYRLYSEANYLEAKSKLRERIHQDLNRELSHYSYSVLKGMR